MRKYYPVLLGIFTAALYAIWLAYPITIITADIGRHLADGRIFFEYPQWRSALLQTNFYSTVASDFPIINHHWAAGLVYWIVQSIAGWKGLHIFQILLGFCSLGLFIDVARRKSSLMTAILVSLTILPLIAYRTEIRPEYMGYALFATILWTTDAVFTRQIAYKWLWALPVCMLVWVNVHASFALGFGLILLYTLQNTLTKTVPMRTMIAVMFSCLIAIIINPSGVAGALYPLSILKDPGYAVFENQSITFLSSIGASNWQFVFLKIVTGVTAIGFGVLIKKHAVRDHLALIIMSAATLLMAWLSVRHITIAAFILVPILSLAIYTVRKRYVTYGLVLCVMISLFFQYKHLSSRWIVLGLEPTANDAADFVKEHDVHGPFFNNFDIGGYMIYHFFPEEKPFVYNRPESHPSDFWRNTYIPMMQDRSVWQQQLATYQFNAIMLFHGDRTQWAQTFLKDTINDPLWAAVFVDRSVIIFVRRNEESRQLIERYEIPTNRLIRS